jgi:hypothetical protein
MPKLHKKPGLKRSPKLKLVAATVSSGRPDPKTSIIIRLLDREKGATVAELATATEWQEHSVCGFM